MSDAQIAYGATVERSDDDGTTWVKIAEAKGVGIPTVETNYLDVTSLDSPDGYREFIKGLKDAGTISIPCNYTRTEYETQLADAALTVPVSYKVELKPATGETTGDTFEFKGFPTPQIDGGDDPEAVMMLNIAVKITGGVSWTKGAA